ncbi:MAG: DDE transposase [Planctomycetota bacterium]|nr:MAG: DDE transposase [Planctomycetota bacterium]
MAMGRRSKADQEALFLSALDLPRSPGHLFYERLNRLLADSGFDEFAEQQCRRFYAEGVGRPSLPPGTYFRLQLIGYFEGIGSERGIAWRCADSLALRTFLGFALDQHTPDHSTISKTRRLLDLETHEAVFAWVLERLADHGLVKGETVSVDATTLEADAAMRSIQRRDDGRSYREYLDHLAQASGVETPRHADRKRVDRKRKKTTSNEDWEHPHDPDARITRLKDGRTRMGYKAEHAVDLDSGAVVAATVQPGDRGDTTSIYETMSEMSDQLARLERAGHAVKEDGLTEVVADKGYHKGELLEDLAQLEVKSYIAEPKRRRRKWKGKEGQQRATYANRRRLQTRRGRHRMRQRAELTERSFAHAFDTGGLRRVTVRGMENVRKRAQLQVAGFNLGLLMRKLIGVGKPRCLQGVAQALSSSARGAVSAASTHMATVGASLDAMLEWRSTWSARCAA